MDFYNKTVKVRFVNLKSILDSIFFVKSKHYKNFRVFIDKQKSFTIILTNLKKNFQLFDRKENGGPKNCFTFEYFLSRLLLYSQSKVQMRNSDKKIQGFLSGSELPFKGTTY